MVKLSGQGWIVLIDRQKKKTKCIRLLVNDANLGDEVFMGVSVIGGRHRPAKNLSKTPKKLTDESSSQHRREKAIQDCRQAFEGIFSVYGIFSAAKWSVLTAWLIRHALLKKGETQRYSFLDRFGLYNSIARFGIAGLHDHILIHDDNHLRSVVTLYTSYFNQERPHQGIEQHVPNYYGLPKSKLTSGRITSKAILSYSRTTYLN